MYGHGMARLKIPYSLYLTPTTVAQLREMGARDAMNVAKWLRQTIEHGVAEYNRRMGRTSMGNGTRETVDRIPSPVHGTPSTARRPMPVFTGKGAGHGR